MPTYAVQNITGDLTSGVTLGSANNSGLPAGATVSPTSYSAVKDKHHLLLVIAGGDVREMTIAEKAAVPTSTVDACRELRKQEIDDKTEKLRSAGFEYPPASGNFFDILDPAMARWIGIKQASDAGVLTSVTIRDKSRNPLILANATDVGNFWGSALTFEVSTTSAGGALLDALDAAATIANIEAVVDTR